MAAIRRHLVVAASVNSIEYVYYQEKRFRVIGRPAEGKIEISLGWSQRKEKTKIVNEDETTTASAAVRFEGVGFRSSRHRMQKVHAEHAQIMN